MQPRTLGVDYPPFSIQSLAICISETMAASLNFVTMNVRHQKMCAICVMGTTCTNDLVGILYLFKFVCKSETLAPSRLGLLFTILFVWCDILAA